MSFAAWVTLGAVWSAIAFLTARFFLMVVRRPDRRPRPDDGGEPPPR